MKQAVLRPAKAADAEGILKIYAPYVTDTAVSFEYDVPAPDEFAGRIETISERYPYLVCELEGETVGFAYASAHRERSAYMWNAELSVYIDKSHCRLGIGHSFYSALIEILKLQNIQTVYGGVAVPNENSEWLHKSLGFEAAGVYRKTGFKLGRWHDVVWYEKQIGSHTTPPRAVVPISEIDGALIADILKKNSRIIRLTGR